MTYLLGNEVAPLTYSWGFLQAPLEVVADTFGSWHKRLNHIMALTPFAAPLGEALRRLEPLSMPPCRELLLSSASPWTAYFDNSLLGGDPAGPVSYLARLVGCKGLTVGCRPSQPWGRARAGDPKSSVRFTLYAPHDTDWLNVQRHISFMRDNGKWVFSATGEPQAFERPEVYRSRRLADRFTPRLLENYCAALGIRLFDAAFYGPGAILAIEDVSRLPPRRYMTLAEYRDKYGVA
jgi:hypothetical protein